MVLDNSRITPASSHKTENFVRGKALSRAAIPWMFGPTGWQATNKSGTPARAAMAASASVAHLNFVMPNASWSWIISLIL